MPPVKISGYTILNNVTIGPNNSVPPVIPPVAPTVNSINTTDTTPTITGTAVMHSGDVLSVEVDGELFDNVPVISGNWSVTVTVPLAAGSQYGIVATVTNTAGATATGTGTVTIEVQPQQSLFMYNLIFNTVTQIGAPAGTSRQLLPTEYLYVYFQDDGSNPWTWDSKFSAGSQSIVFYGNSWFCAQGGDFGSADTIIAEIRLLSDDSVIETTTSTLFVDENFTPAPIDVAVNAQTTSNPYPVITGTATLTPGSTMFVTLDTPQTVIYYNVVPTGSNWSIDTATAVGSAPFAGLTADTFVYVDGVDMYDQRPDANAMITFEEIILPPTVAPTVNSATVSPGWPVVTGTAQMNASNSVLTFTMNGSVYGQASIGDTNVQFNGNNWSSDTSSYDAISGPDNELVAGNTYQVVATITNSAGSISGASATLTVEEAVNSQLTVDDLLTIDQYPIITGTTPAVTDTQDLELNIDGTAWTIVQAGTGGYPAGSWSADTSDAESPWSADGLLPGAYGMSIAIREQPSGDFVNDSGGLLVVSDGSETGADGALFAAGVNTIVGMNAICWGNNEFVAVSSAGESAKTSDPATGWTAGIMSPAGWRGVAYSPSLGLYVAVSGYNGAGGDEAWATTSTDGVVWTAPTVLPAAMTTANTVSWSPTLDLFVAGGYSDTGFNVATSPDGLIWTQQTSTMTEYMASTWSASNNKFVMVGLTNGDNSAYISTNGTTWTAGTTPNDKEFRGVTTTQGTTLVAVGSNFESFPVENMIKSTDGGAVWNWMTPVSLAHGSLATKEYHGVAYSNDKNIIVAVSDRDVSNANFSDYGNEGLVAVSYDNGDTWVPFSYMAGDIPAPRWGAIAYSPTLGVFVAVNSNDAPAINVMIGYFE